MSDGDGGTEPSVEELLDNTPEAVAMRRARAARAEALARDARAPARPAPKATRRKVVLGVIGAVAGARALSGLAGRGR